MVRPQIGRNAQNTSIAVAAFIAAAIFSSSLACPAQPTPSPAQPTASSAAPVGPSPASHSVSEALQPSLDTVHQTLQSLRLDKWKKGTVRDEAGANIDSILRDLRVNMPPLLEAADAAPGTVSKLLPVSGHVDALYDVLLRITEASRVAGPTTRPHNSSRPCSVSAMRASRSTIASRGSAGALEKQVIDLRATIERQAAARPAAPAPAAFPCLPPPTAQPEPTSPPPNPPHP